MVVLENVPCAFEQNMSYSFWMEYFVHATLLQLCLFATLWTVDRQARLFVGSSRQECWDGLLCPAPGDLSDPGIEPEAFMSLTLKSGSLPPVPPGKPQNSLQMSIK